MGWKSIILGALAALAPLPALAQAGPAPGAKYVALGSSFAAGPRITTPADTPPNRCGRSQDNYAHQLARKHGLSLTDVSCNSATTANLLSQWNELAAQLDAVSADTKLVTITVGGNDVLFNARLGAQACHTAGDPKCADTPPAPTEQDYADLQAHMRQLADEVHRRAPGARVVFVDYPAVLPPQGDCAVLSLTPAQADLSRTVYRRVVAITASAARETKSGLIPSSALTAVHHACSAAPWTNGYLRPGDTSHDGPSFHPRLAAHTAIAEALDKLLWR